MSTFPFPVTFEYRDEEGRLRRQTASLVIHRSRRGEEMVRVWLSHDCPSQKLMSLTGIPPQAPVTDPEARKADPNLYDEWWGVWIQALACLGLGMVNEEIVEGVSYVPSGAAAAVLSRYYQDPTAYPSFAPETSGRRLQVRPFAKRVTIAEIERLLSPIGFRVLSFGYDAWGGDGGAPARVSLRDAHRGRPDMTVDEVISALQAIRARHGDGSVPCRILMEPTVGGETMQLDDGLCEVADAAGGPTGYPGLRSVALLGRSFD